MSTKEKSLSVAEISRLFHYADGVLTWKFREPITRYDRFFNSRWAGKPCGTVGEDGYSRTSLRIDGVRYLYLTHRIVFAIVNDRWPADDECVDHRDGERNRNEEPNLRPSDEFGNAQNRCLNRNNSTGFKGVKYRPRTNNFEAYINARRRRIFLGCFDDPVLAARAYDDAARKYHGEFAKTNADLGRYAC